MIPKVGDRVIIRTRPGRHPVYCDGREAIYVGRYREYFILIDSDNADNDDDGILWDDYIPEIANLIHGYAIQNDIDLHNLRGYDMNEHYVFLEPVIKLPEYGGRRKNRLTEEVDIGVLRIGDRVAANAYIKTNRGMITNGDMGTVKVLTDGLLGIEFDKDIGGHDFNGINNVVGKPRHCFYLPSKWVDKVMQPIEMYGRRRKDKLAESVDIDEIKVGDRVYVGEMPAEILRYHFHNYQKYAGQTGKVIMKKRRSEGSPDRLFIHLDSNEGVEPKFNEDIVLEIKSYARKNGIKDIRVIVAPCTSVSVSTPSSIYGKRRRNRLNESNTHKPGKASFNIFLDVLERGKKTFIRCDDNLNKPGYVLFTYTEPVKNTEELLSVLRNKRSLQDAYDILYANRSKRLSFYIAATSSKVEYGFYDTVGNKMLPFGGFPLDTAFFRKFPDRECTHHIVALVRSIKSKNLFLLQSIVNKLSEFRPDARPHVIDDSRVKMSFPVEGIENPDEDAMAGELENFVAGEPWGNKVWCYAVLRDGEVDLYVRLKRKTDIVSAVQSLKNYTEN